MKIRSLDLKHATLLFLACCAQSPAIAQPAWPPPIQAAVVPGERLSDWLLRNAGPNSDTTALHWQVQAERLSQHRLRQAVVQELRQNPKFRQSPQSREQLTDWLLSLPLTGRLTVAIADARWLQSAPSQDPILQEGQQVVLYQRPSSVTVITETGQPCTLDHVSGAQIDDYLRSCLNQQTSDRIDWAWIIQPDGRTHRYGIAPWNQEAQEEPGIGSWIWAPGRDADISPSVSDNLARFLATQAPGEYIAPRNRIKNIAVKRADASTPRDAQITASDWGEIGLLQTPTARMAPSGAVRLNMSRVAPYTRGTIMFQPFDWLEAGFRYTDISNRLYGPRIAGNQTYKDKSIDFKLRLHEESSTLPQFALGVRDFGGTGLFSGEYLVASKRWGNWDASLGLGWGYLGTRGNLRNPLSFLGDNLNTRPVPAANASAAGGTTFNTLFRGPAALFGGLQWHAPSDPWTLKLELDGNDYQHEPQSNNQPVGSPVNLGAVYRYSPNLDFSLGLERGNRWTLGFTLHGGLNTLYSPKLFDPIPPAIQASPPTQPPPQGWASTAQAIELYTGWSVRSITHQQNVTILLAETDGAMHLQERIERTTAALHRDAPASTRRFVIRLQERGLLLSEIAVDRAEWVARHTRAEAPALHLPSQQTSAGHRAWASQAPASDNPAEFWSSRRPGFSAEWSPSYSQILGGPDGFLLYQLGLQSKLEHRFTDNLWLSSAVNLRVLDNYDRFVYDAPSDLPRVRTFQREYVTASRLTLPLLQLTQVGDLGNGHYASAYAGWLESMYGGVGVEWLYRPWQQRFAVGIDVNHVRQRDFRQNLTFRDYQANTGHVTLYWDTNWNDVQVNLSAGRYLAGDVGATLDVKRTFSNGVALGAWATKTNVSAEQFGEGSFDKGIYVSIPFDVMLPRSSGGNGSIIWNPLTRDGGARLSRRFPLYEVTRQRDPRALNWRPASPSSINSAENTSYLLTDPAPNVFDSLGDNTRQLGQQMADVPASTWLWAGGAILASSLLDRRVDQWAVNHPSGTADRLGTATNNLPLAMALGAGMLYTGIAGQPAASTAETALKAAAYTWGANLATRFVVGRARPSNELGNNSFNGFNSDATRSGFPSNHVAVAFALVTPFAQQHDMPWLYTVAAASAFGRVQKREHWVSDTVGGAFMGYAIGSMLSQQQQEKTGMRVSITPQSVVANWTFK